MALFVTGLLQFFALSSPSLVAQRLAVFAENSLPSAGVKGFPAVAASALGASGSAPSPNPRSLFPIIDFCFFVFWADADASFLLFWDIFARKDNPKVTPQKKSARTHKNPPECRFRKEISIFWRETPATSTPAELASSVYRWGLCLNRVTAYRAKTRQNAAFARKC